MESGHLAFGIVYILTGIVVLTCGRKLFWLFVACMGFAAGFHYTTYIWQIPSYLLQIIVAIVIGIIGAVLAVFFQKIAIGLAGFVAGAYIAVNLAGLLGLQTGGIVWLPYLAGGVIGALFLFLIFDWALIIVSSFVGASMIVQAVDISPAVEIGLYFFLIVAGILVQTVWYLKYPPAPKEIRRIAG